MKIDFSQQIVDLDGEPAAFSHKHPVATLGLVAADALLAQTKPGDAPPTNIELIEAFDLARRVHRSAPDTEITPEELVLIKDKITKHQVLPLVSGQALSLLSGF